MNYTTLSVINSTPQDMILSDSNNLSRVVAGKNCRRTTIVPQCGELNEDDAADADADVIDGDVADGDGDGEDDLEVVSKINDDIMVAQQEEQMDANGTIPGGILRFNNKNVDNKKNENCCNIEMKNSTKIKLNFSVDRLLGNSDRLSDPVSDLQRPTMCSALCALDDCRQSRSLGLECCKYNNSSSVFNGLAYNFLNGLTSAISSTTQTAPNLSGLAAILDMKSVVRPTPIRPTNRSSSAFPNSLGGSGSGFNGNQQMLRYISGPGSLSSLNQIKIVSSSIESSYRSPQLVHTESNVSSPSSCSGTTTTTTAASVGNPSAGGTTPSKRKRSWSRAVFSNLQRKGLEIQFQVQKYITKPDRRKLAARLNLTDAQVKVWFQNRRMKWRHTRENLKSGHEKPLNDPTKSIDEPTTTSSDEDEIDVVAE